MKLPPNKSQHIDFACQFKHLLRILTRLGVWARTLTNIECGFRLLKRAIEIGPPIYTSCPSADPAPGQRTRLRAAKREGRLTPGRTELRRLARQPESAYANHGRHAPL